jgi:hypothetical protein
MLGVLASNRVPGGVVSSIKNGRVAWTKAFGVANLQTGTPMRPDMVFNHGSNGIRTCVSEVPYARARAATSSFGRKVIPVAGVDGKTVGLGVAAIIAS